MAISEAKLDANRRNSLKSTGPTSDLGKSRSRLNAVKHGMRAATLVLLDEDAQALDDRRAAWTDSLLPRGAAEQRIVDDAVEYSWLRDRARRAQEARLATNIVNVGVDEAIREADEVLRLGQLLFSDHRGPLANYPHYDRETDGYPESVPLVSQSEIVDGDPEDPQRLVLHLQATAGGCQWMLDRWSELRSILEEGLDWQSADKLKAVRLLGRQPIEAVDDRNVLMIFVACQAIESRTGKIIPEIWYELREYERKPYAQRLIGRGIEKLTPADAAAARQALFNIIDRATAQIALKAEAHRVRAEINDSLAGDRLLFDDSPEAERLRRFDLACGRGLARSLDSLLKLRRAPALVEVPSSVLPDQLSAAGYTLESSASPTATNEPTIARENLTNEPTLGAGVGLENPTYMKAPVEHATREPNANGENVTNEPTADGEIVVIRPIDACENVTNEPTADGEIVVIRPTDACENVTNEATDVRDNATNEATDARTNMANEPTLASDDGLESPTYTNATEQNSTNEPPFAAPCDGEGGLAMTAGMNDGVDSDSPEEIDRAKSREWIREELARMRAIRAESRRKLNEQSRREARAARRPRPEWHKNAKAAERPKKGAARNRLRETGTNTPRPADDFGAELVKVGSGPTNRPGPD